MKPLRERAREVIGTLTTLAAIESFALEIRNGALEEAAKAIYVHSSGCVKIFGWPFSEELTPEELIDGCNCGFSKDPAIVKIRVLKSDAKESEK